MYSNTTAFTHLMNSLSEIENGNLRHANELLKRATLLDTPSSYEHSPERIKTYLFANALSLRLGTNKPVLQNPYLGSYEVPQIDLFNLLATQVPLVKTAAFIANQQLVKAISSHSKVTLVDIGIGTGRQIVELLYSLSQLDQVPELNIIGVDPALQGLLQAEKVIRKTAEKLAIQVTFRFLAKSVESITSQEWQQLTQSKSPLIINCAFSLHHICKTDGAFDEDPKNAVLQELLALQPSALILTEPNSDHQTQDLYERFYNAWNHFGLAFSVIDQLQLKHEEKNGIKFHFFARELNDILGYEESMRCERHETAEMWINRLHQVGFKLDFCEEGFCSKLSEKVIGISRRKNYVSLDYDQESIIAVICARSE